MKWMAMAFSIALAAAACSDDPATTDDDGGNGGSTSLGGGTTSTTSGGAGGGEQNYVGFEDAPTDCSSCLPVAVGDNGVCEPQYDYCLSRGAECTAALQCVNGCDGSSDYLGCVSACQSMFPGFEDSLTPYLTCLCCTSGCSTKCMGTCAPWGSVAGPAFCGG